MYDELVNEIRDEFFMSGTTMIVIVIGGHHFRDKIRHHFDVYDISNVVASIPKVFVPGDTLSIETVYSRTHYLLKGHLPEKETVVERARSYWMKQQFDIGKE